MASRSLVSYDDITAPYVVPSKRRKRSKRSRPAEGDEAVDDTTQSRELTHEEIWDDSALVEAWNAAMEEYEAYHGPDKGWKEEPLHKSPLWYNVPPKKKVEHDNPQPDESDSQPVDFASFVPTHDPSLSTALPTVEPDPAAQLLISQDEAFRRAVQASYWSGYWTAVYNFHRQSQMTQPETNRTEDYDINSSDEEQVEELLSTQQ